MSNFLNFIKNCFPYRNIELRSPLTVEEAKHKLQKNIESRCEHFVPTGNNFSGEIFDDNSFRIKRYSMNRNGFLPMIYGNIEEIEEPAGSLISVVVKPNPAISLIIIIFYPLILVGILAQNDTSQQGINKLFGLVTFSILSYGAWSQPFFTEYPITKKILQDLFNAKEIQAK